VGGGAVLLAGKLIGMELQTHFMLRALEVVVNDIQTYGSMIEGIEMVSNLITRYTLVEKHYLREQSDLQQQLSEGIVKVYAAVLTYLSRARRYYDRRTSGE
jgi:hypothetical protein